MEIWKRVPSLPAYEASSFGRIRRVPYFGRMPNGGTRVYGGKPWTGTWDGARFVMQYQGRTRRVARLVCAAFHGVPPPWTPVCMHLDENSRNNRPENLKWGTQKENLNAPGFRAYARSGPAGSRKKIA